MSGVIRWESPASGRTVAAAAEAERWQPVADDLRERPNDWAVIAEGDTREFGRITSYIRDGRGPFTPRGAFEAKQRTHAERGKGRIGWLYARYVGGAA